MLLYYFKERWLLGFFFTWFFISITVIYVHRNTFSTSVSRRTNSAYVRTRNATTGKLEYEPITVLKKLLKDESSQKDGVSYPEVDGYIDINYIQKLKLHCNTCSLVASSGHLLNSYAGSKIDRSDCVLRMNDAPTKGFEEDVGARTDVRIVGFTNIIRQSERFLGETRQKLLFDNWDTQTKYLVMHWGHSEFNHTRQFKERTESRVMWFFSQWYPSVNFYTFSQEKVKASIKMSEKMFGGDRRFFPGFDPSTGWFSMLFALDICDKIDVYGMVPHWYCYYNPSQELPYHYYNSLYNSTLQECSYVNTRENANHPAHRMPTEKAFFAQWAAEKKNIKFFYPSWNYGEKREPSFLRRIKKRVQSRKRRKAKPKP